MNARNNIKEYRRYLRINEKKRPELVHVLINIRSHIGNFAKHIILDACRHKCLDRQSGIYNMIVDHFERQCFYQAQSRRTMFGVGKKTYRKDGKFYSYNPDEVCHELPF